MKHKQKYWNFLILAIATVTFWLNIFVTSQTLAKAVSMKEEIAQMVTRQAQAWETQDVGGISNDFAPDALFIAAGFRFEGKRQIENAARDYFKQFDNTSVEIKRIIIDGQQGAVQWNWQDRNRQTGKIGYAEDAIVFELKNEKIIYWREYIEKKQAL